MNRSDEGTLNWPVVFVALSDWNRDAQIGHIGFCLLGLFLGDTLCLVLHTVLVDKVQRGVGD
jgi:hypothetical protein